MTTAAQIIAAKLHEAGCRHAFGMPGGEVLLLMQAMHEAGIEFTLCKHENNAGYLAEGSYHATGVPGILLTTIGPGLANGLNSVANAYQEQVPLIVLSGCIGRGEAESFTHQVIDQSALMAPITKAQFQVAKGSAQQVIEKALMIARADPPGPVHVDVPHDIAGSEVAVIARALLAPLPAAWPEGASLEAARKMLSSAKNPIILAGLGAVHHGAGADILAVAEAGEIPVLTTYKAKGLIDENHPLCLGGHGLSPLSDTVVLPLLRASDCIILAGYDPIEMRNGWIEPWDAGKAIEILHADIQHGMHGAAVRFVGDVSLGVAALLPAVTTKSGGAPKVRAKLAEMFAPRENWGPHQVFDTVLAALPEGGIATADSGAHRILLSQMWRCKTPQTLLQSTCFCTMGIALPLAMGYAKAAGPDGPKVVAFVGDAGFEMVIGELATARDMGINLTVVVLVDEALSLIDLKQSRSNLPQLGVNFGATNIVAVAKAYGGHSEWVNDKKELIGATNRAFNNEGFTVLACKIEKSEYAGAF
ncbi:MAG: thiamine pyrophosphate-binding protein [Rhodobacteraceae bacterium]|nr:thiamine pyrophosphate-binding protein [Paracoccaceae bacterium]